MKHRRMDLGQTVFIGRDSRTTGLQLERAGSELCGLLLLSLAGGCIGGIHKLKGFRGHWTW